MNIRTKKLILGICLLALLCISYVFIIPKNNNADEESSSSNNESSIKLGSFEADDITAISFNGINLTLKDSQWIYANDGDYPVDNDKAGSLAATLAYLSYTDAIKKSEAEDLSVYGFEQVSGNDTSSENIEYNNIALEISFTANNTAHTYYVGAYNSIINGYYMTFDNDDFIYMVSTDIINAFDYETIYELLVIDIIPDIDAAYMISMTVATPETNYTFIPEILSVENTENDTAESGTEKESGSDTLSIIWYMQAADIASGTTSEKSAVDTDEFSTIINDILTASVGRAVAYKPSDKELIEYGLSIPAYTITITYVDEDNDTEEKTFTLSIGSLDDEGNLYAVINNSKMIVTISNIDLEALLQ